MRIVLWVKGARGVACLKALAAEGENLLLVVLQNQPRADWFQEATALAAARAWPVKTIDDPNDAAVIEELKTLKADLFILAGYGRILGQEVIAVPRLMCLNLHGGMLPEQRGSSPLNWSLINGQDEFGLSILQVDRGVDTGDLLAQRRFSLGPDDTIADLHRTANAAFPEMLLEVLAEIKSGRIRPIPQDQSKAAYYPARFPDDGLVMFDQKTARQVHNLIRALSPPYPGAYTYYQGRKVKLLASGLREIDYFGSPGRIYQIKDQSLLVCARDKCLWIHEAIFDDDQSPLVHGVKRYDRLATVQEAAEQYYLSRR